MKKFVMIATILVAMSFSGVKSQNNKHSVGIETSYNFLKAGIGARYGYDFTNILRFTIDGTYYLTSSRSLDVYKGTSKTRTLRNGRLWESNANINLVFGEKKFHFYLLTGIGFAYGYKVKGLLDSFKDLKLYDENGNYIGEGITESQVSSHSRIGLSLNGGCGIEWQITPNFCWNFEQSLNIGLPSLTTWMWRTGVAYCF